MSEQQRESVTTEPVKRRVGGMTIAGLVLLGIVVLVAAVEGGANIGTFIWGGIGVVLIVAGRVVDAIRARG